VPKRNATAAVIGAGDFIGGEIAKKPPKDFRSSPAAVTVPSSNRW
jgi:hypothetical protein